MQGDGNFFDDNGGRRSQSEKTCIFNVKKVTCLLTASAMKHSAKLLTPAQALYRALQPSCQLQQRRWQSQGTFTPFGSRKSTPPPQSRMDPRAPPLQSRVDPREAQLMPGVQKKLAGYVLNNDIEAPNVQIRTEDGKLGPPQPLRTLLSSIDRSSEVVRQLAAQGPNPNTAVVEVQEISALLKMVAQRDQAVRELEKSRKDQKAKQIELNWAISGNDLELKLKQMEQFLDKGKKVEVVLASRKRQRKAEEDEAQTLMKKLRERIEEVGAKEMKLEGRLLGQAMMTVQKKS